MILHFYKNSVKEIFYYFTILNQRVSTLEDFILYGPYDKRIFRPAGTENTLKKLRKAFKSRGYRHILLHGLGGTGKTNLAKYFANKELGLHTFYLCLPLDESEAKSSYFVIYSFLRRYGAQMSIILDEIEKLRNLEVIGWMCKILELDILLKIGITNRPWVVLNNLNDIWRRFMDEGCLIFARPHTHREVLHIVNAVIKKLAIKEFFPYEVRKELAQHLLGYDYKAISKLFKLAKESGDVSSETILRLVRARRVIPSHPEQVIRSYTNDLHTLGCWESV